MKRVAVLGGGPAGAFAAERLQSAGLEAVVLDEKLAWEKPCGGGLTAKAYGRYPFLLDNDLPKRFVTEATLAAPPAGATTLALRQPLVIYSRCDLNGLLLGRAAGAGARVEKTHAIEARRSGAGWRIRTSGGAIEADFLIVATGARNGLRDFGTAWRRRDTMIALGYYVPASQSRIEIEFVPGLEGYIWVFPRADHLSAGICGKGVAAAALRARLEAFLRERGISFRDARFYSHMLPSLDASAWAGNRVSGPGWLAVGDAAGLVDPITGEGLYYALRSADLAAQAVASSPARAQDTYRALLEQDFAADLAFGATLSRRLYQGRFLFGRVPERMVQFARRSPTFRSVLRALFDGTQLYRTLRPELIGGLARSVCEIASSVVRDRGPDPSTRKTV